jgi:hypothetical protein
MIDWCLTPIIAVFQLCRGVNKFYKLISNAIRLLEMGSGTKEKLTILYF